MAAIFASEGSSLPENVKAPQVGPNPGQNIPPKKIEPKEVTSSMGSITEGKYEGETVNGKREGKGKFASSKGEYEGE